VERTISRNAFKNGRRRNMEADLNAKNTLASLPPPSAVLLRRTGRRPVVFGTQDACGNLPLSPCEERAGRESERGEIDKKRLLSPALSSLLEEERERKCGCALKANLLPNTINWSATTALATVLEP